MIYDCVFCRRVERRQYDQQSHDAVTFEPLNPVVPGHQLVVSRRHVSDAAEDPIITGEVMRLAALVAGKIGSDANIITSIGPDATQTVFHLHVHVVPRRRGDGLHLPWTGQDRPLAVSATEPGGAQLPGRPS